MLSLSPSSSSSSQATIKRTVRSIVLEIASRAKEQSPSSTAAEQVVDDAGLSPSQRLESGLTGPSPPPDYHHHGDQAAGGYNAMEEVNKLFDEDDDDDEDSGFGFDPNEAVPAAPMVESITYHDNLETTAGAGAAVAVESQEAEEPETILHFAPPGESVSNRE